MLYARKELNMTANKGEFDMNTAHCYNIKKYYTE